MTLKPFPSRSDLPTPASDTSASDFVSSRVSLPSFSPHEKNQKRENSRELKGLEPSLDLRDDVSIDVAISNFRDVTTS